MKKATSKKGSNVVALALVGAGLAAAAAGAYAFLGPKGKANQKRAKDWAAKMKADVVKKINAAKAVSEPIYREIIDSVAETYVKTSPEGKKEVQALARDLKKHWKSIAKSARIVKSGIVAGAQRVAKQAKKTR